MKFLIAMLVWGVMALVLGAGIILAAKGSYWLLGLSMVGFLVGIWRIGCTSH